MDIYRGGDVCPVDGKPWWNRGGGGGSGGAQPSRVRNAQHTAQHGEKQDGRAR